jgi:hypothetical protein
LESEAPRTAWYRKTRYIVLIAFLAILLIFTFVPLGSSPPKSRDQVALDRAVTYFVTDYNGTLGLISEYPGSHVFWLSSDNYLASLALTRYSSSNQSTMSYGDVLFAALAGYESTLPPALMQNEYSALNSTSGYFDCSANYAASWSAGGQLASGSGSAMLMTTANNQSPSCAGQNYADLLFLQAIHYHKVGNSTAAADYYQAGAKDFDGRGFVDLANEGSNQTAPSYQTYKVALYVYASICLGEQGSAANLQTAESTLLHMQSNSTGGFATSYGSSITPTSGVNTETTALAALALELMITPTAAC